MNVNKIQRGIRNPELVKAKIFHEFYRLKGKIPHDLGIQGSYNSGNIGDRAIGELLKSKATDRDYRTFLFDKNIDQTNGRVRVLAGGGVIHDWYGSDHLQTRLGYVENGGLILGVGVPGLQSEESQRIVHEKLKTVDKITVRNERSKRRLQTAYGGEIEVTACPAMLYDDPETPSTGRTGVNFVPCFDKPAEVLSYYFDYEENIDVENAMDAYVSNAQKIVDRLDNPVLIPFHKDDVKFAEQHLDVEVLPYTYDVDETLRRVSSVDRMVATRFHSFVFSVVCETPTLPIAYAPKVSTLADRLEMESYRPHETVELDFQLPKRVQSVKKAAARNLKIVFKRLAASNG